MTDCQTNTVEIEVRPFKHQVGGHTCVLEVTKSVIGKPYVSREVWFYENEPDELKEFTPKYLGNTFVTCDIQKDRKCLVALVPESIVSKHALSNPEFPEATALDGEAKRPSKKRKRSKSRTSTALNDSATLEAWSSTCIERQINRYGFWANNQPQQFILLENLVYKYGRPCLMDLKMGRRQFGDDSDEQKRQLLQSRCASSTSATLGFRICGSQSFKVKEQQYVVHDKYVGRNLDGKGAKEELRNFFFNGELVRTDVIRKILDKLESLWKILMKQDLLFYSVSLLLLYDGTMPVCSEKSECQSESSNFGCVQQKTSYKVSSLGLKEEFRKLNGEQEETSAIQNGDSSPNAKFRDHAELVPNIIVNGNPMNESDEKVVDNVKVDVRMIDFAHVSQKRVGIEQAGNFADETIVFGLTHLHKTLTAILQESC